MTTLCVSTLIQVNATVDLPLPHRIYAQQVTTAMLVQLFLQLAQSVLTHLRAVTTNSLIAQSAQADTIASAEVFQLQLSSVRSVTTVLKAQMMPMQRNAHKDTCVHMAPKHPLFVLKVLTKLTKCNHLALIALLVGTVTKKA